MTIRATTINHLETGEIVLAQSEPNRHFWAMVIRTQNEDEGIAFLTFPDEGNDAIFMDYQAVVLATGKRLRIVIESDSLSGPIDNSLPDPRQPGSKLCIMPDGPFLLITEQTRSASHFSRTFFVDVNGNAFDFDDMPSRHEEKYRIHSWSWKLEDESAVVLADGAHE